MDAQITKLETLTSDDVLGPDGILSQVLDGYEHRTEQLAMARLVQDCIATGHDGIVEAGTGTGKSFAYLVPAILSHRNCIVSTANKTLQTQLTAKDLPLLREILSPFGYDFEFSVAKGKSNYLCVAKARKGLPLPFRRWAATTETGDLDEAPAVPSAEEQRAMCAGDDCTGKNCPFYADCFYYRAKRVRFQADVVVTNHALLCQHLMLPFAELLPEVPVCIVDEAHQLEGYAIGCQSIEVSPWSFRRAAKPFAQQGQEFLQALAGDRLRDNGDSDVLIPPQACYEEGLTLAEALSEASREIAEQGEFELAIARGSNGSSYDHDLAQAEADAKEMRNLAQRIRVLAEPTPEGYVRHVTRRKGVLVGCATRFDVSEMLAGLGALFDTVIYTSATLSTAGGFAYFRERNGVGAAQELIVSGPFDYQRQCLLYVPMEHGMPDPRRNRGRFDLAVQRQMWLLTQASQGGALLLFTSYNSMHAAANTLSQHLSYPVRRQGDLPKSALIDWLRSTPNAVLCATASFWEGVDIPGEALRLVAIDKIPFEAPGPVEKARQDAAGKRAFLSLVVPEATLRLKQGFGRLLRSRTDHGVVALLDPRLWTQRYGLQIVDALPDATVTTSIDDVRAFFQTG